MAVGLPKAKYQVARARTANVTTPRLLEQAA
jgi:hypothetical protein